MLLLLFCCQLQLIGFQNTVVNLLMLHFSTSKACLPFSYWFYNCFTINFLIDKPYYPKHYFLCNIRCSNLRGELRINFRTQCVNMTLAGGEGALSLVRFWSSQKLSNFKVHEWSQTVSELCTCLIINERKIAKLIRY